MEQVENTLDEAQLKELVIVNSIPSIYTNKYYIGIDGDMFRLTFCEHNQDSNDLQARTSVILPLSGIFQLMQMCQMILKVKADRDQKSISDQQTRKDELQ